MKYHASFVIFEKRQNLKLSSAANYRWCFMGLNLYLKETPFNAFANRAVPDQAALTELPDQGLLCLLMEI